MLLLLQSLLRSFVLPPPPTRTRYQLVGLGEKSTPSPSPPLSFPGSKVISNPFSPLSPSFFPMGDRDHRPRPSSVCSLLLLFLQAEKKNLVVYGEGKRLKGSFFFWRTSKAGSEGPEATGERELPLAKPSFGLDFYSGGRKRSEEGEDLQTLPALGEDDEDRGVAVRPSVIPLSFVGVSQGVEEREAGSKSKRKQSHLPQCAGLAEKSRGRGESTVQGPQVLFPYPPPPPLARHFDHYQHREKKRVVRRRPSPIRKLPLSSFLPTSSPNNSLLSLPLTRCIKTLLELDVDAPGLHP